MANHTVPERRRSWFPLSQLCHTVIGRWLPGRKEAGEASDSPERLDHMRRDFEQAVVRLGIIGESGSGKSSLSNAIVGRPIAAVGALVETTQQAQEVPVDGVVLVDLPGCGTPTWPRETYIDKLKLLDSYDGFILVTAHRLKECDAMLYEELARKAKKPFFIVRSHFDQAAAAHPEAEARKVISENIRRQLHADERLPLYMVCSVGTHHYDLERLILNVRSALPGWKQVRFIMAAHAYGRETVTQKREAAEQVVGIYAGLSAANALNPIPGLDIGVDVGLLTTMSRHIISTYGLRPEQVEALKSQSTMRTALYQSARQAADRFAPYLTEKFVVAALTKMGMKVAVKNTSKWVPFVGTAISAGIGYTLAFRYGEQLIDDCESAALTIIDDVEAAVT